MANTNRLKRFVIALLITPILVAFWLIVDSPVEPGRTLVGVVTQSVYIPARYSDGYTRYVVQIEGGKIVIFRRYGQSYLRPGMHVSVLLRKRRLSNFNDYTLLY
jgi:hypothetical protein